MQGSWEKLTGNARQNAGNEDDMQDEDDQDKQNAAAAADDDEPQTRAAFNLLRSSYDSDAAFVHELFGQPLLQQKIRLVCYDLQDLHQEYATALTQSDQDETMKACAGRASYRWLGTVRAMLQQLCGKGLVAGLNLFPRAPWTLP